MTDRIDHIRAQRDVAAVKWAEFLRIKGNHPKRTVCFFEGEDAEYFGVRIRAIWGDSSDWTFIDCKGKDVVLKLVGLYKNSAAKVDGGLFFVDRDFDLPVDLPQDNFVYVTPCYSVENLYVSGAVAERILFTRCKLNPNDESDDTFNVCVKAYNARLDEFVHEVQLLNNWVAAMRHRERGKRAPERLNLNNLKLQKLFSIELDLVKGTYSKEVIESELGVVAGLGDQEVLDAGAALLDAGTYLSVRGKFLVYFVRTFFERLSADKSTAAPKLLKSSKKVSISIERDGFISQLSQYADVPSCLVTFLSRMRPQAHAVASLSDLQ